MPFDDFVQDFLKILRYCLVKFDPSTRVDACLSFVATFAVCLPTKQNDDDISAFLKILFGFLFKVNFSFFHSPLLGRVLKILLLGQQRSR